MKNSSNLVVLLASSIMATGFAVEAKAIECKQIQAQIISSSTSTGCTSPIGLCTAGTIDGNQGLNGTTFFTADSIAPGPNTAPNPSDTISYSGILQIATEHGTLTIRDTGIFDTSIETSTSGFFSNFDTVISGTGKYQGATGHFFISGKTISGQFVSNVATGELCFP